MFRFARLKSIALASALAAVPAIAPAATNSSLDSLTVTQSFPAWQSTVTYQLPSTGGPMFFGNYARINSQITYDASTQSYIIKDTGSSATSSFGPANKDTVNSNASYTYYNKTNGTTTETLKLLNPGTTNPTIQLHYASYGAWRKTTTGAGYQGATTVADTYFVYGIKTASTDVPRTGTATYNAILDGSFINGHGVYTLSGNGSFVAHWSTATINFAATPTGTPASGPVINFGTVSGSGPIYFSNSSFMGNPDSLNPNYKMSVAGYFYGPAASEIGATFRLWGTARGGGSGAGAMVGKQ